MQTSLAPTGYAEVHGEPTRSFHKEFLARKIAWRLQALAEGDLTERARRRAAELANDADVRVRAPHHLRLAGMDGRPVAVKNLKAPHDQRLPLPGSMLTREYKGRQINVRVLEKGFEYEGEVYRSLTAVAKVIKARACGGWFAAMRRARRTAPTGLPHRTPC